MDFSEILDMARQSRAKYREVEQQCYGRQWGTQDLVMGFVGDVGDLARLIGAHEAVRPGPDDLPSALAHELADCLWSILVIAQSLDVDIEAAYVDLHQELLRRATAKLAAPKPE